MTAKVVTVCDFCGFESSDYQDFHDGGSSSCSTSPGCCNGCFHENDVFFKMDLMIDQLRATFPHAEVHLGSARAACEPEK